MKEIKMGMRRRIKDGREWRLPGLLYEDNLVLFSMVLKVL